MWNSNSFVAWLLERSGIDASAINPPPGGRAPGWIAGIIAARRAGPRSVLVKQRSADHVFAAAASLACVALFYEKFMRNRILNWGSTSEEATAHLPGDELLENADGVATRAITIDAPASAVWPWIAQMGPAPRGGAYTYDWIENLLGLKMHSSDRVLSEYQHPRVGAALEYGGNRMRFERVEARRVLAMRSEDGNWVWSFILDERDGKTRLVSRNRFRLPSLAARIGIVPMEPGSLIMERKMLHGIKQRAERLAAQRKEQVSDRRTPMSQRRSRSRT